MKYFHYQSKLGMWLLLHDLDKEWLEDKTVIPIVRIYKVLNDPHYKPDGTTMRAILSVLKTQDNTVKLSDFWDV